MKLFLPLFFCSFLISSPLFSQNKIGQIAYANWSVEEGKWNYHSHDTWTYNEDGKEKTFTRLDTRYSDYTPTNNTQSISKYSSDGTLVEKNTLYYGPNQWENIFTKYKYNSDGRQTEEWFTRTNSQNEEAKIYKYLFDKDDIENSSSIKFYRKNEAGDFILESLTDSIFNDQNCLVENSIFNYYGDGSIQYGRKWEMEYTNDCQLLQSDFYRWDPNLESMEPKDQDIYEYFNDGELMIITFMKFDNNTNQWEIEHITETEINDDGEKIRYFVETFRNNSIDSTLQLYTYTSQNEIETFQQFGMINTSEGKVFERTRNDSFGYYYNLENRIILKEEYYQNYVNPVVKNTTTYEYYCNGQLKSEVVEGNQPYYRTDYRYDGGVDCPLEEGDKAMMIFPNPTSGIITVQANLLANSEATIQIFTLLGQEVFLEKINQMSYQYQLDLSSLGRGHYFVSISNQNKKVTEKLVIF